MTRMDGQRLHAALVPVAAALLAATATGCAEFLELLPRENCNAPRELSLIDAVEHGRATLAAIDGIDDAIWLDIVPHTGLTTGLPSGKIGGYLSPDESPRRGLILALGGASTLEAGGRFQAVLQHYRTYSVHYREAGYRVWAPVLFEDEAYGTREADETVELLDWLEAEGKAQLGVERVFVIGYSTGATVANFANLRGRATAFVSLAGLTEPGSLQSSGSLYRSVANLFPCNVAMAQVLATLDEYEGTDWSRFEIVGRVAELRNPALFVANEDDRLQNSANAHDLEAAYRAAVSAGAAMPELTFEYYPSGGHFSYVESPDVLQRVLDYLATFEPK